MAAAAHLVAAEHRPFVRVNIPCSLSHLVDVTDDVALSIGGLRPGWPRRRLDAVWDVAREVSGAAAAARSRPAVEAVSAATEQLWTSGLDRDGALGALIAANSFELLISNQGVVEPIEPVGAGHVAVEAVWGPVLLNQQQDEQVVGITTYGRRLRVLRVSHRPTPGLLEAVRELLLAS